MRRGIVSTIAFEQETGKSNRLSSVFWDTFTGSAHYKEVLFRMMHPENVFRLAWHTAKGLLPFPAARSRTGG